MIRSELAGPSLSRLRTTRSIAMYGGLSQCVSFLLAVYLSTATVLVCVGDPVLSLRLLLVLLIAVNSSSFATCLDYAYAACALEDTTVLRAEPAGDRLFLLVLLANMAYFGSVVLSLDDARYVEFLSAYASEFWVQVFCAMMHRYPGAHTRGKRERRSALSLSLSLCVNGVVSVCAACRSAMLRRGCDLPVLAAVVADSLDKPLVPSIVHRLAP